MCEIRLILSVCVYVIRCVHDGLFVTFICWFLVCLFVFVCSAAPGCVLVVCVCVCGYVCDGMCCVACV